MSDVLLLNRVYDCGARMYELTEIKDASFIEHSTHYVNEEGLLRLCEKSSLRDFSINNGFVMWSGKEIKYGPELLEHAGTVLDITYDKDTLIYYLHKLSMLGARFVSKSAAESILLTEEFPEEGIVRLSTTRVSSSTMRVYISYIENKRWHSLSFIEYDKFLRFNSFIFMISSDQEVDIEGISHFSKLKTVTIKGMEYSLYIFEETVPLYVDYNIDPGFNASMINHKIYTVELNRSTSRLASLMRDSLLDQMGLLKEPEKIESSPSSGYPKEKRGVHFKYIGPKMSYDDHGVALRELRDLVEMARNGTSWDKLIAKLSEGRKEHIYMNAVGTLLFSLYRGFSSMQEACDSLQQLILEKDSEALGVELDLFALRMHYMAKEIPLPDYSSKYEITGGLSPGLTEVRRV